MEDIEAIAKDLNTISRKIGMARRVSTDDSESAIDHLADALDQLLCIIAHATDVCTDGESFWVEE